MAVLFLTSLGNIDAVLFLSSLGKIEAVLSKLTVDESEFYGSNEL